MRGSSNWDDASRKSGADAAWDGVPANCKTIGKIQVKLAKRSASRGLFKREFRVSSGRKNGGFAPEFGFIAFVPSHVLSVWASITRRGFV